MTTYTKQHNIQNYFYADILTTCTAPKFSLAFVRVVTRYMGSGITASGSGSWTRDPGSQVMGSGSANFFWSWRGSRIDRFLDTLFFMRNKNIPFCKEKVLFSGLLKKLLTFILQFFYVSVTQSAV